MIKRQPLIDLDNPVPDNPVADQELPEQDDKPADTVDEIKSDDVLPASLRLRRNVPFGR